MYNLGSVHPVYIVDPKQWGPTSVKSTIPTEQLRGGCPLTESHAERIQRTVYTGPRPTPKHGLYGAVGVQCQLWKPRVRPDKTRREKRSDGDQMEIR